MKVFKILCKIFQICATVMFLASLVICGITASDSLGDTAFLTEMVSFTGVFVLGTVGMFLLCAKSDTARRVGHGLVVSSFATGLMAGILFIDESTAAILMIVAVVLLLFYYICRLVLFIFGKDNDDNDPQEDIRIRRVREWKSIMDEGIISAEEYEEKRCHILGIKKESSKNLRKPNNPDTDHNN